MTAAMRRPARRARLGLAAVLAVGATIAGTATSGTTAVSAAGNVTITWWSGQIDAAAKVLQDLVDEYQQAHPGVTIKLEEGATPDDMRTKLEVALGTDTYPDIAYVYGSDAPALARSPKVVDLTEWVKNPSVNWDDFWGAERAAATVGGRVIAMPAVVGDLGIIYNKALFKAAGVAEPTKDWTWDDFRAAAKALTNADDKVFGTAFNGSGTEGTVAPFWPLIWQQGLDVLAADGKTVGWNDPKAVAALELLRAMAVDDKSMFVDLNGGDAESLFTSDKIAMLITGPWSLSSMVDTKKDYGVQVLPGYGGNHETTGGQDLWMLFDHGDAARTAAAQEFITWITLAEQDAKWSISQYNLPIRATTKERPEFAQVSKDLPGYADFVANLEWAKKARPPVQYYPEVSRLLGEQIAAVLLAQTDAASAIAAAADAANAAITEALADG